MIDPASTGDWIQASVLGGLLAGATLMFVRMLRPEERRVLTVAVPTIAQEARARVQRRSA